MQQQVNLYNTPLKPLFSRIKDSFKFQYDFGKHVIQIENDEYQSLAYIRLPLHLKVTEELEIINNESIVLYLSIQSGNAAICIMKGKENVYHTTFSSYMTRKKQGFSQVKYLNKKGKSRAGSRVRLASTLEFFEKINCTLKTQFQDFEFDRIALDCSKTLIPYLHQSKIACSFDKKDAKLYKIPLHITQSNYTDLNGAIKKLMAPILFYDNKNAGLLSELSLVLLDE